MRVIIPIENGKIITSGGIKYWLIDESKKNITVYWSCGGKSKSQLTRDRIEREKQYYKEVSEEEAALLLDL